MNYSGTLFRLGILVAFTMSVGCTRVTVPHETVGSALPIRQVTVIRPDRKSIARTTTQPGYIEAFEEAPIFARVSGYVKRLGADIGDPVHGPKYDSDGKLIEPGQVLVELAVPELVDHVEQKQSLVAHAETAIVQATTAVEVADSAVSVARARRREADAMVARTEAEAERWRLEYERMAKLVASQSVEQKLEEEARNGWRASQAAQTEAAARVDAADAAVAEAAASARKAQADEQVVRAQHRVSEANLRHAQTMLDYATLRAPFDGVVVQRNVNNGHYVHAERADQNKPLFIVAQADVVRVFLDVPETEASQVGSGDPAEVSVQALSQRSFSGKVTRTSWGLDAATRTLHAEVDVPNPDGALRPGMYAQVTVISDERNGVLVLPVTAISGEKGKAHCVAIREGKAVFVPIALGLRVGEEVEIMTGLAGDEAIVSAGVGGIAEGQPLAVASQPQK